MSTRFLDLLIAFAIGASSILLVMNYADGKHAAAHEQHLLRDQEVVDVLLERNRLCIESRRMDTTTALLESIKRIAALEGIPSDIAVELVRTESNFRQFAVSRVRAYGLTQVKLSTARIYEPTITREEVFDVDMNLRIGFKYLSDMYERFGSWEQALSAYNMGPTRVAQLGVVSTGYSRKIVGD